MADITITAANVVKVDTGTQYEGEGIAGTTITAGMPLYIDASDSNSLKPGDADAATTDHIVGIALHAASDGQPIKYYKSGGIINMGATLTVGQVYVLSTTAGGVAPYSDLASGDYVTILGVAITAANLQLGIINSAVAKP